MKTRTAKLRPAEGRRVRHPDGRLFDPEGEPVPTIGYYARLFAAGDLEKVPAARNAAQPSAKKGSNS